MFTEIKEITSTLAELSKGYETLSSRELNKSLDYFSRSLDNFQEGILPNKEEGLRREAEVEEELEKNTQNLRGMKSFRRPICVIPKEKSFEIQKHVKHVGLIL